jgi:hypothetical protein
MLPFDWFSVLAQTRPLVLAWGAAGDLAPVAVVYLIDIWD